jgi:hypothetical protein
MDHDKINMIPEPGRLRRKAGIALSSLADTPRRVCQADAFGAFLSICVLGWSIWLCHGCTGLPKEIPSLLPTLAAMLWLSYTLCSIIIQSHWAPYFRTIGSANLPHA